ncbi:hypothetical protein ACS0TY_007887 [Phlomoides rotata]
MGASNSKFEEDKSLQLCRARKKFIKQGLNGRCSLAAAHIAYIEELKIIGAALRRFVEFDAVPDESLVHPSRSQTPEPRSLKSVSRSSFSSQTRSQNVDATANLSPSSSTPVSSQFQSHNMKFRGAFSRKVEEKPPASVSVSVDSTYPPPSTEAPKPEASSFENPIPSEEAPWDYFGLFDQVDNRFTSPEGQGFDQASDNFDEIRHPRVEAGVSEIEEEKLSLDGIDESQESEDEFDEPSSDTLVRSFKNVNREKENVINGDSSHISSKDKVLENNTENGIEANEKLVNGGDSPTKLSEIKPVNGKKNNSPDLSPLRATSSRYVHLNDVKITPMKHSEVEEVEDKVAPKDFFSSMKDIERLFVKASEAGKEVPRMLEANKFHFRPVYPGKELGSSLLKSCFSCGEDPTEVPKEPPQDSVKYLTWHRTTSSRSASSRNLLGANSIDGAEDVTKNLFDDFCMVSGSHASTLDRLYAWEKKLYDEVKASQILRSNFDQKCKLLRHQESQEQNTDKTRASVKALHSRIRVAVQRIEYISKKIEEIRDKELQPQLEELIEGLRKMWEMILDCHKLQFHIISVSHTPGSTNIIMHSDSRRQITIHLGNVLSAFSSVFKNGIAAQKQYVEALDKWLIKCVVLPQHRSKRSRRLKPPQLIRDNGPPIYVICGTWLEMLNAVPAKAVLDSIKDLASEVSHFLPHQEKTHGKGGKHGEPVSKNEVSEDRVPALDRFRISLACFLGQLNNCAESTVKMFSDLQKIIQEAKDNYGH